MAQTQIVMYTGCATRHGFTLIELLVVITIIVILLALMTPALDKAIYQAQLVQCAAGERAVAGGVLNYAAEYRRRFPYRPPVDNASIWTTGAFRIPWLNPSHDDRFALKGYTPFGAFIDPLMDPGNIDLDPDVGPPEGSDPTLSQVSTSYIMIWSFRYFQGGTPMANDGTSIFGGGMMKIGDRLRYFNTRYSVLFGDTFSPWEGAGSPVIASHPDAHGVIQLSARYNDGIAIAHDTYFGVIGRSDTGSHRFGDLDLNFAMQDLSVGRYRATNFKHDPSTTMSDLSGYPLRPSYAQSQAAFYEELPGIVLNMMPMD